MAFHEPLPLSKTFLAQELVRAKAPGGLGLIQKSCRTPHLLASPTHLVGRCKPRNYDGEVSVHSLECLQKKLLPAACTVTRADEQDAAEATDDAEGAVVDEVLLKAGTKSTDAVLGRTAPLTEAVSYTHLTLPTTPYV